MSNNRPGGGNTDDSFRTHPVGGHWRKSSFSLSNGDCVEVAHLSNNRVGVRDSKATAEPYLRFSQGMWMAFLGDIQNQKRSEPYLDT